MKGTVINYVPDYEIKPIKSNFDIKLAPFIPFGADNLFPQATALFARSSPLHRGVINSKKTYVVGGGITSEEEQLLEEFKKVNFEGESLTDVASKFYLDRYLGGNSWIEIITDIRRSFLWFNHLDYTKCRLSKDSREVLIHPDWMYYSGRSDAKIKRLPLYPEFINEKNEYGVFVSRSVIQVKDYEPEFYFYGVPCWVPGKDSVLIDLKTNKWNLARLKNAFSPSGFLIVPVKDAAEGDAVIKYIEEQHIGEGNQAKLMVLTKSRAQDGEKADATQYIPNAQTDDGSWDKLHNQSSTDIIIAHNWFRALTSLPDNTGFDTQRILNEYNVAQNTVIRDEQRVFTSTIQRIYKEQQKREIDLGFINKPPVEDNSYMKVWEIRKRQGLDFDETDPVQNQIIIPSGFTTLGNGTGNKI